MQLFWRHPHHRYSLGLVPLFLLGVIPSFDQSLHNLLLLDKLLGEEIQHCCFVGDRRSRDNFANELGNELQFILHEELRDDTCNVFSEVQLAELSGNISCSCGVESPAHDTFLLEKLSEPAVILSISFSVRL